MEDTYTVLRHFADSWWLLGMMTFFLGAVAFALRPGLSRLHREIADIPMRDDDLTRLEEDAPRAASGAANGAATGAATAHGADKER